MKRRAFTLVELLVVIAVIIILVSVSIPAVRSMLRDNSRAQAVNVIRAQLSAARTIAIAQHRQAGVIFFEETVANAPTPNTNQTAMQIIVESPDQAGAAQGNTIFVYYSKDRQYLPTGIRVAALNDDASKQILTGDNTGGKSRVVLFDANGQMITRNGVARQDAVGTADGGYPKAYADWNVTTKAGAASDGISSPGLLVFSMKDYNDAGLTTDSAKAQWVQQHADVLVINAYTGNIINNK